MNNNKGNKLPAIIVLGGVALSIIFLFLGAKTENQTVALVGVGLFFATVAAGIFIGNGSGAGKASRELRTNAKKYEPLLLDERTKQHPEVQRLLQYTSVQKVFFDPPYFKTSEAQNDPNVRELLAVFDDILSGGAAYGGFNGTNVYTDSLSRNEIMRREKEKNKPRRIAGTVLMLVGIGLFVIPFFTVFFSSMSSPESTTSAKSASFLFTAAPFGMVLIIIGSILKK
ncbi:MAG: hypothetical protein K2J80_04410 [Oscillospiraceae bacterium]|nr:hypothetical protein [Oscillospiraceae bacterium]